MGAEREGMRKCADVKTKTSDNFTADRVPRSCICLFRDQLYYIFDVLLIYTKTHRKYLGYVWLMPFKTYHYTGVFKNLVSKQLKTKHQTELYTQITRPNTSVLVFIIFSNFQIDRTM